MPIQMTVSIARAAGQDFANRRMKKAGRNNWSRADYNSAVREMNRILKAAGMPV